MSNNDLKINLPSTPFPMEAKLIDRLQPEVLQKWRAMDIYRVILEDRRTAESFILHDGPPFASGQTHIGIGFNKILKDIIIKYHTMRGKRVPFVPGWDCHGLPIEADVLDEAAQERTSLSALEIRERCTSKASQHIQEQKSLFQTLGIFADWDRPYSTMTPSYEAGVLDVLAEVLAKGYVYRGLRPVHWCSECETVLADVEIKEHDIEKDNAFIGFQLNGNVNKLAGDEKNKPLIFVPIKELWMLPSSTALAIPPDLKLVAFSYKNANDSEQVIVVEKGSIENVCRHLNIYDWNIIRNFKAEELSNSSVVHPLTNKNIPLILDIVANQRSESGIALITPAHNINDYNFALKHNLDLDIPVLIDKQGNFTGDAGNLSGKNIQSAEEVILSTLKTSKTPLFVVKLQQKEDRGLRCNHSVFMFPTKQWFVKIDHREQNDDKTLRQKALEEVDSLIQWIHAEDKQELYKKIEIRPDWCISRQRNWGIPIPTIVCSFCKEVLLKTEVVQVARDMIALYGSQYWFSLDFSEFISNLRLKELKCDKCGKNKFEKDLQPSVLDVWFESGTSWRSVLIGDHRLSFPADLCIEGEDQHRGWFQMSLLLALIIRGKSPFVTALAHGFILDEKRRTMSKFEKNFLSLEEVLHKVPVDLIRLYFVLNKNIRENFPLAIQSIRDLEPEYRTFRNCFRYLLQNLNDYIPSEHSVPLTKLNDIDKWILCRLHRLVDDVTKDYSTYKFKEAMVKLYDFCNNKLSKIYFEAVKDTLKYEASYSSQRRSVQTAMHSLIMALVKMLAPIMVYTCEEVWSYCPGVYDCSSVHQSLWIYEREGIWLRLEREGNNLEKEYDWMLELRNALQNKFERAKQSHIFSSNNEIRLTLYAKPSTGNSADILTRRKQELKEFLSVSEIILADTADGIEELPEIAGVFYKLEKSPYSTCLRCRRHDITVAEESDKLSYCSRCIDVLFTPATAYKYAPYPLITPKTPPVEIAKYMKQLEIRKVAFLIEEGKVVPYYFHLPSQQVRANTGLQPLADYLERHQDFKNHSAVLMGLGEHTDILFGIGIHQLKHGTPLGGTREFTYENVGEMLENLLRLSYGMSIKNAIANLPHGGGKSIIDTCDFDLKIHRELRKRIYRDFGQFTATLFGRYICAEDYNNTAADTREMLAWCRHVMCLPEGVGGSGNPSRFTALVGWLAAKIGWQFWQERENKPAPTTNLDGATIAVQGVGNVGFNLIDILTEGESGLKKILIADNEPVPIENVEKLLRRKGKAHLLEIRSAKDPLVNKNNATEKEVAALRQSLQNGENENSYILYSRCDVLIPSAVGNVIYEQNADLLNCRVIVPIANNTYSDNDSVGRKIWERGIVDVVEGNVNWGGATVAASELYGYDEDHVIDWCVEKICNETMELLKNSFETHTPPWEIKKQEAEKKFREPHSVIKVAREGKFIVDISKDFNKWIKEKWLRNITSVGPDKFAKHVSVKTQNYLDSEQ